MRQGVVDSEIHIVISKWWEIERLKNASICKCPICGRSHQDMRFNPSANLWFCIECFVLDYSKSMDKDLIENTGMSIEHIHELITKLTGKEGCQFTKDNFRCGGSDSK